MLLSVVSKLICVCVVPPNLKTVAYVYKEGNTKGKKLEFPITFPAIVQQICLYVLQQFPANNSASKCTCISCS